MAAQFTTHGEPRLPCRACGMVDTAAATRSAAALPPPPRLAAEPPEGLLHDPLLTESFMAEAFNKYTAPQLVTQAGAAEHKAFAIRQLNVMDPLLPTNNLGRSVSKASFLRIRRAFEHGAKVLAQIADQAKVRGRRGLAPQGLAPRARCGPLQPPSADRQ